jgi:hypothetical protein
MPIPQTLPRPSPLREVLDSFEHAYAVATRWRGTGASPVYVVRTSVPLQPIRVTTAFPLGDDRVIMVLL